MSSNFKEDSIYTKIVNESRYLNMTVMFIVQSSLSVPDSLREGASIVFCKRVNDKKEARVLSDILNLTSKEQSDLLIHLELADGIFINKEKGSIPVSIVNGAYQTVAVSDSEIERHQDLHLNEILNGVRRSVEVSEKEDKSSLEEEIDYNMLLVMMDLVKFPFDFQSERSDRLNINVGIISKVLANCVTTGFLDKSNDKINLGKGKSPFQPYLLSEKGVKKFGKQIIKGKGSIKHAFWQYRCAKHFNTKNYKTKIEYFLEGGFSSVDVVAEKVSEKIAIEIELNKTDHIQVNISKCLDADFSLIVIAVYGSEMMKYMKNILLTNLKFEEEFKRERIVVKMLPEFLDIE